MTIPTSSNYPNSIDSENNLYLVRDSLRLVLAEDYIPGDTSITIIPGADIMSLFPDTGLITLTEQCSESENKAISFYYGSKTDTTFDQLELLEGFNDTVKPKNITNVTQNVMAEHHNNLKNALIEIQHFAGKKGQASGRPLEGTMEQRINYLRNIALAPKAWFKADKTLGLAPLRVTFTDLSFRLGTDGVSQSIEHMWDFGDNTPPSIITIEEDDEVLPNISNVLVSDIDGGTIIKTYTKPGFYTVTLKVTNDFGSDTVIFTDLINARFSAPDFATINLLPRAGQLLEQSGLPNKGPYTTIPRIRACVNTLIDIEIPIDDPSTIDNEGVRDPLPNGDVYNCKGELLDLNNLPIDPIKTYTWGISDDLAHSNSYKTRASFSIGGLYDLTLRVDTTYGSYRITSYSDCFDIIEKVNLWLWNYTTNNESAVEAVEFGLISETFKLAQTSTHNLIRNTNFLDELCEIPQNVACGNIEQLIREFKRNVGFAQTTTSTSGNSGDSALFYAGGRSSIQPSSDERIEKISFNGFSKIYSDPDFKFRPWNWISLSSNSKTYFILGNALAQPISTSPTNQARSAFNYFSGNFEDLIPASYANDNYLNGSVELTQNEVTYDAGLPEQGHLSIYRSCWYNDTGYFLRNQGVGDFFRIRSFYKTLAVGDDEIRNITKLPDMSGAARVEGQLVPLSNGVYFFTNSGAVAVYSQITGVWATGGPGVNSAAFRNLQDNTVIGFDNPEQTFLCASDKDRVAYLSFDYSNNAFIKFNEVDTTFSSVTSRPNKKQWNMNIF